MIKIYYFSGTGNTYWSAKEICKKLQDAGNECSIYNIAAEIRKDDRTLEAERIVFLFPVYAYQTPEMVRKFIQTHTINSPYIAAIATYGSSPGGAMAEVARIIKRKGSHLSFACALPAVENYIPIFGAPSKKKISRRLEQQQSGTATAALSINKRRENFVWVFRPFSALVSALFCLGKKSFAKNYIVTPACSGCGLCAKLCPAQAIRMENGKPVFSSACEHCQACMNWCAQKAILYLRLKADTPRYTHPEVTLKEMLIN
jgi:ferredoxin/flavodoxin